eukprot:TRINITY_DN15418_c0_g1_i1.p1 TRINITY_DN15418_c0_g1~~TRINITY_DN15418_c0_g1_i1.p1  ORF type:complete len:765 (+),score=233.27 TRINITY_DN15418_c0_g1_i1:182-2296(+)
MALDLRPSEAVEATSKAASGADSSIVAAAAKPDTAVETDMLRRFEALSQMFKSEVEVLFGQEKETAKEEHERIRERATSLENDLAKQQEEVCEAIAAIRQFVSAHQASQLPQIFGDKAASGGDASNLKQVIQAFLEANSAQIRPELDEAQKRIRELSRQVEADRELKATLHTELIEARKLKSQEEKELIEFKSLRDKDSQAQQYKMEAQQLRAEMEEIRTQSRQILARSEQQNAIMKEKSEKIIELIKQLEQQSEQVRLLADENNTLRLELGRDSEYLQVVAAPSDPLSYRCSAGVLSDELQSESQRLSEDMRSMATKFPGLSSQGNCSNWCELQISRASDTYQSFLHRFQDYQKDFPEGVKVEFVSKTAEVENEWTQQDLLMKEAGNEFQEAEKVHNRRWEEHRLKLTSERDAKVQQLLNQAEISKSKAEQQLLLHQAKLFGQRIDQQLERAWEEQRKERDLRWTEHQQKRQDARQRIKEESLATAQRAEEHASASSRFVDVASGKLAAIEDAWLRNAEKAGSLSAQSLKNCDLSECLRAARRATADGAVASEGSSMRGDPKLPSRGSQHTGLGLIMDQVEELLRCRTEVRRSLFKELEEQSRQQLRGCVEKFIQKEALGLSEKKGKSLKEEDDVSVGHSQASAIISLLQMRQHRHLGDAMRRQFQDFLLVLRLCSLGAKWLLPQGQQNISNGLPPLPVETFW